MSAKTLINEIMEQHYTNIGKKKSDEKTKGPEQEILYEHNEDEPQAVEAKKKRKRRTKAEMEAAKESAVESPIVKKQRRVRRPKCEMVPTEITPSTFSITIVGGIGLPGYPLKEGEKLAVVKLTPIAIGK